MNVAALDNMDCPDCDEAGLDTHDKVCDHAYLRRQIQDVADAFWSLPSRRALPRWKRELSDEIGVDHNG